MAAGATYSLYAYGGVGRDIKLTVDRDGDGGLADETAAVVAGEREKLQAQKQALEKLQEQQERIRTL